MNTFTLIQLVISLTFLPTFYLFYKKNFIKLCRFKQFIPAWLFSFFIVYNLEFNILDNNIVLTLLLIILGISQLIFKCDK